MSSQNNNPDQQQNIASAKKKSSWWTSIASGFLSATSIALQIVCLVTPPIGWVVLGGIAALNASISVYEYYAKVQDNNKKALEKKLSQKEVSVSQGDNIINVVSNTITIAGIIASAAAAVIIPGGFLFSALSMASNTATIAAVAKSSLDTQKKEEDKPEPAATPELEKTPKPVATPEPEKAAEVTHTKSLTTNTSLETPPLSPVTTPTQAPNAASALPQSPQEDPTLFTPLFSPARSTAPQEQPLKARIIAKPGLIKRAINCWNQFWNGKKVNSQLDLSNLDNIGGHVSPTPHQNSPRTM